MFYDFGQDFHMLVANPRKQKLNIQVKDSLGFTDLTVGTGEVNYLIPKNSFFFGENTKLSFMFSLNGSLI